MTDKSVSFECVLESVPKQKRTPEDVRNLLKLMEPLSGLKPETFRLRIECSIN